MQSTQDYSGAFAGRPTATTWSRVRKNSMPFEIAGVAMQISPIPLVASSSYLEPFNTDESRRILLAYRVTECRPHGVPRVKPDMRHTFGLFGGILAAAGQPTGTPGARLGPKTARLRGLTGDLAGLNC